MFINFKRANVGAALNRRQRRAYALTSKEWQKIRLHVLKLANYACAACGRFADTADHIDENPNNNSLANLQALCRPCHGKKAAALGTGAHKLAKNALNSPLNPTPNT